MLVLHTDAAAGPGLKLRKVLALKGAPYGLAGAADERPWLQWGRRVFVGPVLAIIAIEAAHPDPTVFPNGNRGMPLALGFWSALATARSQDDPQARRAHAMLAARQLADGRAFLQGARPGMADIEAWSFLAATGGQDGLAGLAPLLAAWFARVEDLGFGDARPGTPADWRSLPADAGADAVDIDGLAEAHVVDHPALGPIRLEMPRL